ncbi:MAG: right-handed parallel beta-helix repeat-containing protein [Bacteroidota bacterium]|nr:right-handed parallel beta-helix repeat-containing protein [Bacteroidota bacterium]
MRTLATILVVVFLVSVSNATTNVSGTISKDSTWTSGGSPYMVTGSVTVGSGFTLTVDSGVTVLFQPGTNLYAYGNLHARQAVFTSSKDTSGGSPQKGDWGTIQIGYYASTPTATFDTCRFQFGGANGSSIVYLQYGSASLQGCTIANSSTNGINTYSGTLSVTNSNISNATNTGITFDGTSVTLTNVTITSCDWPLRYGSTSSLVFNGVNNLTGNNHNGVYMNFGSTGNMVLDTVSIPYYFPGDFTVNSGATLQIASADILKFNGGHLYVRGALVAVAGQGEGIYFTSYLDDNHGGDTNDDGGVSAPATGNWYGVYFEGSTMDSLSVMRRCYVYFAGAGNTGGITMNNASPTIDSCNMVKNYYGAMMQGVSSPKFTNNTIGSSQIVPIAMSFSANPIFSNNTFSFSDNAYDAIGLLGGTLPTSSVLPIRSVTSIPNVTYLLLDQITVPSGVTLTINKGIVIKGYSDYQVITVQGKLVANGTADSAIVITSAKDDNFGNPHDTNKDGNTSAPAVGDWGGIVFEPGSDSASILNYCRLTYGSLPWTWSHYYNNTEYYQGEISTFNASPTISNCSIGNVVYGVYAALASHPKVINDTIFNTQYTPVAMSVSANPTFSGIKFVNAGWTALGLLGEYVATNGEVKQRNVAGYTNITYAVLADITINAATYVTVDPGVVIKSNGPGIYVNGGFKAKGTITAGNVVFTSLKDDNYGNPGDTNGDGQGTSPSPGDWSTIQFLGTSDDSFCTLDSCLIKFGGGSYGSWGLVTFTDANGTLSNCTLADSYAFGIRCENSSAPQVNNVVISSCKSDPIGMSLLSNPSFTNITFTANGSKGIRILEGTLSSNATLATRNIAGITNVAYIVNQLTIAPSAVLTIQPGVVIKLLYNWWADYSINVQGALVANGTKTEPIVFTSMADDSYGGDTNNDGNTTSPDKGNWCSIDFNASAADSLNSMHHCIIRYGGYHYNNFYYYSTQYYELGMVRYYNAGALMDSSTIEQSSTSAVGAFGSGHPAITNTQMLNTANTPVTLSMFSTPAFSGITALNVGDMAIGIVPETYSVSGTVPVRNFAGYTNITYLLYGTCTVNTGTTITIPAGIVCKGGNWQVNGALAVNGNALHPVIFTDPADDTYGNPFDTNQDGSATKPSIQNGNRISFAEVSTDSLCALRYAVVRYVDGGIYLQQASPTITHCTFDKTNWGVYLKGVSTPSLDSCMFRNLTYAPMQTSAISYPRSTLNDSISGTTYKGIGILNYETLAQDVTLPKRNFAGFNNIPYLFQNYTVASNATLTIAPGVILKFFPGTGMNVSKGLMAVGGATLDSTIVFTDLRDDFYGGDTNADSTLTNPAQYTGNPYYWNPGWNGITFADQSLDPLCKLSHCVLRYAGINYSYNNTGAAVTANNASPTITYSSIRDCGNGIVANGASNPVINYCDLYHNANLGVDNVNQSFVIDARWNWWGSNTGPTVASNTGGSGQAISAGVNYSPFLGTGAMNPLEGDVSLNGDIQAYDASLILKWLADSTSNPLNDIQRSVADVSGNGSIMAYDAALILQYVVGRITLFPAELKKANQTPQPFFAKAAAYSSLVLSDDNVQRGQEFTVYLSASGLKNVLSADIELSFNKSELRAVSVKPIGIAADARVEDNISDGKVRIYLASANTLASDGQLLAVTFEANNDVRGNVVSPITFSRFYLNEQDVKSAAKNSGVSIKGKPTNYALEQNYPNPFNPTTIVAYQVPDDNLLVKIEIYNIAGQRVRTLVNEVQNAGEYKVTWKGDNNEGIKVGSGVYLLRMQSGSFTQIKKMMLLK